ncbi:MAG: phosphotransferase, partial [Betaproteobacteria bacterium]|nr:phosphotransferase [Betaproteobacteria bacterium]
MVSFTDPTREQAFAQWLARVGPAHGLLPDTVASASSDASFRRYLRIATQGGGSFVIMDAPPDKEDCRPFVHVAQLLAQGGLTAPRVIEANLADGFLLLSDLGDTVYLAALKAARQADMPRCDALYRDAIGALLRLQALADMHAPHGLPPYDRTRLVTEMALFEQWYVTQHLQATLSDAERTGLQRCTELIVQSNLAQAQVLVHRDYHSRNLMVQASGNPGILDFQDAVIGPITYDLVSLLRDAYIAWPEQQQIDWAIRYWEL